MYIWVHLRVIVNCGFRYKKKKGTCDVIVSLSSGVALNFNGGNVGLAHL